MGSPLLVAFFAREQNPVVGKALGHVVFHRTSTRDRTLGGRKPLAVPSWDLGDLGVSFIITLLPGIIGALCAYISLKALLFLGIGSVEVEIAVFFLAYIATTALAEKAMVRHGTGSG